ncbi:TrbG/VirB9 family P-type conjugative transfer protein [Gluconacetobacter diazotrophicus]|uniref:TrbG/VirB9 family P-type conjugative transfer protein n=1 Tax=Gluconacetobacter diazotrophicus TaxID=33996 RepID=A0A7W4FF92_GLUDI|nr:TrbG/VirB9 family P-type conjugative transfer protein [Gluconacetobacter diazotrophicus]MBB2156627.1 TrbG/VirB9 family P-type conjugative transfer protein [Gluconacetobacter diazotrophicus]
MKWIPLPLIVLAAGLSGCGNDGNTQPVEVVTPGLPSPERALQQSLDRVHGFMESLNQRLPTPARESVPLAMTMPRTPHPALAMSPRVGSTPSLSVTPREARPLYGKGGIVWFGFADGFSRIHCAAGGLCMIRLQAGEHLSGDHTVMVQQAGWRFTFIRGTHGIHATPAVIVDPSANATRTVLHVDTDRRSYALELVPTGPTMKAVAFAYADGDPQSQPEPPPVETDTLKPDFDYHITGPDVPWKPLRVYRDGGRTYIQFPPGGILAAPRVTVLAPHHLTPEIRQSVADSYVIDGPIDDMLLSVGFGANRVELHVKHESGQSHA